MLVQAKQKGTRRAASYHCGINVISRGKSAAAAKLMAIMGLGIKQGETVTVTVEGGNEEANTAAMEKFLQDNL